MKNKLQLSILVLLFSQGMQMVSAQDSQVIDIRSDDFNVLMGYQGNLEGSIKYSPLKNVANAEKDNDVVYGFTDTNDKISWKVNVPEEAEYLVAIQHTGKKFHSAINGGVKPNCTIQLMVNGVMIEAELKGLTQYNEFTKVAGNRVWFKERLPLKKGENIIVFHFSKISEEQVEAAEDELKNGTLKKSSNSIAIKDLVLVRPEIYSKMKERAKELKPDLSWMIEGKYGLFIHWSLLTYPLYGAEKAYKNFEWGVNNFDVEVFADMVEETGASWVTFTTCHGGQYFPAPTKALENVMPGRTTERDLIAELADALNKRDIKLLLYYNMSPRGEVAAKLGIQETPEKWLEYLINFAEEVSLRYRNKIAGWGYIDSSVAAYVLNMPWEKYYRALKAGNSDAVVAISSHWWAQYSPFNDLQTSDAGWSIGDPLDDRLFKDGGRYEGIQQHASFVLDGAWIPREPYNGVIRSDANAKEGPTFSEEEYIDYFKKMDAANIPVTVNILITQDVIKGQPFVNAKSVELLKKIKNKLK
ncbi:alpha-L-fucosidase [Flavivirga aquimarina]|uniref:Alpha-L-fucosidase n=1 Tax=Flavivirga aquimarina TaxID=2027862 RepID=A0ABT8W6L5_9FLAO|nr:alpha-L-fucosidase [Flavivirga aquimarina]MDO5968756.1 alpha-L-fucosidase [Flavivirga aquimarina]